MIEEMTKRHIEVGRIEKLNESIPLCTYRIKNAGLVIITPFIKYLFQTIGYTKDNQFWDEISKHKAAAILNYIVFSETYPQDCNFTLNKLLCDIDLNVDLKIDFQLSKCDKDNCRTMLEAVIQNWSSLNNTSILGLKESFLLREGTLAKEEGIWRLLIPRSPYDILIDRIPWTFDRVKLPWMNIEIRSTWTENQ